MIEPPRCEAQRGLKIFGLEIWHLFQDLLRREACCEEVEHVADADPHAPNTRPPAALLGVDCDSVGDRVHGRDNTNRTAAMWTCPDCNHRFTSRNLPHSCGRHRIEEHFAGKDPVVRKIWRRLAQVVRSCGKVTIYAQKSRIVCMVDVRFASAVVRKKSIECGLWLDRRVEHPSLARVLPLARGAYHYFLFNDPAEIDDAFAALVREAYASHARAARR